MGVRGKQLREGLECPQHSILICLYEPRRPVCFPSTAVQGSRRHLSVTKLGGPPWRGCFGALSSDVLIAGPHADTCFWSPSRLHNTRMPGARVPYGSPPALPPPNIHEKSASGQPMPTEGVFRPIPTVLASSIEVGPRDCVCFLDCSVGFSALIPSLPRQGDRSALETVAGSVGCWSPSALRKCSYNGPPTSLPMWFYTGLIIV